VEPQDRIVRYVDITNARPRREDLSRPDVSSWHGMMTSVVACGNGTLSDGFYRGVASEARLVLVKVRQHEPRRRTRHPPRARLGGAQPQALRHPHRQRELRRRLRGLLPAATRSRRRRSAARAAGILVCAAVGNQGTARAIRCCRRPPRRPCSRWAALDDHNRLAFAGYDMYHSSYGPTVDGLQKPEVIAPGIWVAAPILPGTPTARQAQLLATLGRDGRGAARADRGPSGRRPRPRRRGRPGAAARPPARGAKMRGNNVISGAYKHVDGTSFAAPIVSSIAPR
jgi:serine protease AprX